MDLWSYWFKLDYGIIFSKFFVLLDIILIVIWISSYLLGAELPLQSNFSFITAVIFLGAYIFLKLDNRKK